MDIKKHKTFLLESSHVKSIYAHGGVNHDRIVNNACTQIPTETDSPLGACHLATLIVGLSELHIYMLIKQNSVGN